ncbi:MAG: outer membrane protein [Candidatus Kryptoniota bacterium]
MRKLTILLPVLMLLAYSTVQSQTIIAPTSGSKALLFNFSGLSDLGANAYMGGIGGKIFLSDNLALRAMLQFGLSDSTIKSEVPNTTNATDDITTFGIEAALEYHFPISSRVSPYVGGGAYFNVYSETQTGSVPTGEAATSITDSYSTFGLGAILGVEYFFNQNISLGAEYQFGISTLSTSYAGSSGNSGFNLGFQTAGLTLGVYF